MGRSPRAGIVALLCIMAIQVPMVVRANHTACRQWDGNDGSDVFNAPDDTRCDEMWTYGGQDTVFGQGGGDTFHMGAEADEAHGQNGDDFPIYGGDNGNVTRDRLYGGPGNDAILDDTGPDDDLVCGGDNNDNPLSVDDGDGQDDAKGEGGADDQLFGDPGLGDNLMQDGNCV